MKTNRKVTKLAAMMALATGLAVIAPVRLTAEQPIITHLDFSYVNTDFCDIPVLLHFTATEISRFNPGTGKFTSTFNSRTEYTNLLNGKTIRGIGAGPYYVRDDGTQVYDGLFMVHTPDGMVVDAGIEEIVFVYDPDTGTGEFVTLNHLGTESDTSDVWAAVCAALQ